MGSEVKRRLKMDEDKKDIEVRREVRSEGE
jgi:hypothetical protein